jgi:mevalonate kinase
MTPTSDAFRANGKLMITGEYLALFGCKVLTVPTKFGQTLKVDFQPENTEPTIHWNSLNHQGQSWFSGTFHPGKTSATNDPIHSNLQKLIHWMHQHQPFNLGRYTVTSQLEFPAEWGLGSSSSLIALLAQWTKIDPYPFFYQTHNGSGYDVAAALHDTPLLFQRREENPIVQPIHWRPDFAEQLLFIYLGTKQNSSREVAKFLGSQTDVAREIQSINDLTDAIVNSPDLQTFEQILIAHEDIISRLLQRPPVREKQLKGYPGVTKSLGAWGGDYVLATKAKGWREWLLKNDFNTFFEWDEIILKPTISD